MIAENNALTTALHFSEILKCQVEEISVVILALNNAPFVGLVFVIYNLTPVLQFYNGVYFIGTVTDTVYAAYK